MACPSLLHRAICAIGSLCFLCLAVRFAAGQDLATRTGQVAEPSAGSPTTEIPLTIETALELALKNSEELRYGRLNRDMEAERYRLSLRSFLPGVSFSYGQDDSVLYYGPDYHTRRVSIGIEQLLYCGGARRYERKKMRMELGVLERSLSEQIRELSLEVVNLYIEILKFRLQREILEGSYRNSLIQAEIAKEELRLGEITELDFLQILLAVKELEIETASMQHEEESLLYRLKKLLRLDQSLAAEPVGRINPDFLGMLPTENADYYLESACKNSAELNNKTLAIACLRRALKAAQLSWLPAISAEAELSLAGEEFPLSEPGFSLGLNFDFNAPLFPVHTGISAGSGKAGQRSAGLSSSIDLVENLESFEAVRIARLQLLKAKTESEEYRNDLFFSIRQQLQLRKHLIETLKLMKEKLDLEQRRHSIQAWKLEIGDITRLEFVQHDIELARLRIGIFTEIVSLFQLESSLLHRCGLKILRTSHKYIIASEEDSR